MLLPSLLTTELVFFPATVSGSRDTGYQAVAMLVFQLFTAFSVPSIRELQRGFEGQGHQRGFEKNLRAVAGQDEEYHQHNLLAATAQRGNGGGGYARREPKAPDLF